jgi:serine/threonine-protein kinase RsbW
MPRPRRHRILSGLDAKDLIGRANELERLMAHAGPMGRRRGLRLLVAPGVGTSELLKQTYDRLFVEQKEVIPFYFAFRTGDENVAAAAERFVYEFILQAVAFRRQDDAIISASPGLEELSQLAAPADGKWIDRLVEAVSRRAETSPRPFVRDSLAAPGRSSSQGTGVACFLDDVHNAHYLDPRLFEELKEVFARSEVPFVFAARRRFDFGPIDADRMELEPLSFDDAGRMIESTADRLDVKVTDEARDLIAVQLAGNVSFMSTMIREAAEKRIAIDSFQAVEQLYADSIFGDGISRWLDLNLVGSIPMRELEATIDILYDTAVLKDTGVTVDAWRRVSETSGSHSALDLLNLHEVIRISSNRVELPPENVALHDYISARYRLEIDGEIRALVYGESLAGYTRRAPELMTGFYRKRAAVSVRELMISFNRQTVPLAMLDYGRFRDDLKGLPDQDILRIAAESEEKIVLPKNFFVTNASAYDRAAAVELENERVVAAKGNIGTEEIVWLAAEIDSKLETSAELTALWCDRLETVARESGFSDFRIWLIAPEGFSPEALAILADRRGYGSSRKQFELLKAEIGAVKVRPSAEHQYEIVLPMGEDAELIAANAVEEIARRSNFSSKAINQVKTALVEACINASEHSLSPDQKIYQKFSVDDEKLSITISNRGLRLADRQPVESEPTEGRRGWGLQLMRRLMDEVTIEDVDDGTRISMIKYLRPTEPTVKAA